MKWLSLWWFNPQYFRVVEGCRLPIVWICKTAILSAQFLHNDVHSTQSPKLTNGKWKNDVVISGHLFSDFKSHCHHWSLFWTCIVICLFLILAVQKVSKFHWAEGRVMFCILAKVAASIGMDRNSCLSSSVADVFLLFKNCDDQLKHFIFSTFSFKFWRCYIKLFSMSCRSMLLFMSGIWSGSTLKILCV